MSKFVSRRGSLHRFYMASGSPPQARQAFERDKSKQICLASLQPAGGAAGCGFAADADGSNVSGPTMGITKPALLVIGILAALIGLIWIGQGTGYFLYPATSFMINQMPWVYWGALLAAVGLAAVVVSRWI
jgi:hypothetical protein